MSSDSESDVHHGLKRRAKLLARAIDRQWVDCWVGRAVLHDTARRREPARVSERRKSLATEQTTAVFQVFGRSLVSGSDSDSGLKLGDGDYCATSNTGSRAKLNATAGMARSGDVACYAVTGMLRSKFKGSNPDTGR